MIQALLEYRYLQNAFIASILASVACAVIGTIIIEKRLIMMTGGIAHTSFGGIGMGYFLKIEPIIGAYIFALTAALGISVIKRKVNSKTDVIMAIFWSTGMALGILFIGFAPGYPPDLSSYLFGDILTVTTSEILFMLILDLVIIFILTGFFKYIKAYLFDEEFSYVMGISTKVFEYVMLILISLTIVILIRVVGIILIIALLTVPPAAVKIFSMNLKKIIIYSIIASIIICFSGLLLSYYLDIASGASIILISGIFYLISVTIKKANNGHVQSKI